MVFCYSCCEPRNFCDTPLASTAAEAANRARTMAGHRHADQKPRKVHVSLCFISEMSRRNNVVSLALQALARWTLRYMHGPSFCRSPVISCKLRKWYSSSGKQTVRFSLQTALHMLNSNEISLHFSTCLKLTIRLQASWKSAFLNRSRFRRLGRADALQLRHTCSYCTRVESV